MISNKIIKIYKSNIFDKGWTLFAPFCFDFNVNKKFVSNSSSDIVKIITYAKTINLILNCKCLPSSVVKELLWVNKYAKINIVAPNENIIEYYNNISFSSVTIDKNINFNYISILNDDFQCFFISNGFIKSDETVERIIFQKETNQMNNFDFLKNVEKLILIDKNGDNDFSTLVTASKGKNIELFYVVDERSFSIKNFNYAKQLGINLLVGKIVNNGIISINKDLTISEIILGLQGSYIAYDIKDFSAFFNVLYKCCFYDNKINVKDIKNDTLFCYNGKLQKLYFEKKKIVNINVEEMRMNDFINEKFSSKICDSHNDYCLEFVDVEYCFNLIPPLINETYKVSKIYDPIDQLNIKINSISNLDINEIKKEYNSIIEKDVGFLSFFDFIVNFRKVFNEMVKNNRYKGYFKFLSESLNTYQNFLKNIQKYCCDIFLGINTRSSVTKFEEIDKEIGGYETTVSEKKSLIEKNIDVLSNKRRIEVLTNKINNLKLIKQGFIEKNDSINNKKEQNFAIFYQDVLNEKESKNNESISGVLNRNIDEKYVKLTNFIKKNLFSIKIYTESIIVVLNELLLIEIPEDYVVYEKDNKRFIVIDNLDEFESTKDICEKFNLSCLTRR